MAEMTSRERIMTAFRHQEPDRVPLFAFAVDPKFLKTLGRGNALDAFDVLGLDAFPMRVQSWCGGTPLMASLFMDIPEDLQTGGGIFAGWDGVDEFGRVWRRGSYIDGALKTKEDVDRFIPSPRLEERVPVRSMQRLRSLYPDKCYAVNVHLGPFGLTMESMGFERSFLTLYDDRDLVKHVIDRRADWFI
ncbi:MAG: uroporphyrinogen decarboxylase family protein, partial [Proteobacteria bacterium]|nr:uroporphyrinogen decarboxylase family protein [Pseudomonadota bacterium]